MYYANDKMGVLGRIFVDMYYPTTIDDFVQDKERIPAPNWKPITLVNSTNVLIFFYDVSLSLEDNAYSISDMTNSLFVNRAVCPGWTSMQSSAHSAVQEGRHHKIVVQYNPLEEKAYLHSCHKLGPPSTESETEEDDMLSEFQGQV